MTKTIIIRHAPDYQSNQIKEMEMEIEMEEILRKTLFFTDESSERCRNILEKKFKVMPWPKKIFWIFDFFTTLGKEGKGGNATSTDLVPFCLIIF